MDLREIPNDLPIPKDDGGCKHLKNFRIPPISLRNQDGNLLKLNRLDTFRLVLYCFPMTGRPDKPLPNKWKSIPGASGCTSQNCSFRDSYDELIIMNAIPIGVSTQSVDDIKEMVDRLKIPFDVVSDYFLEFGYKLSLPTFSVNNKTFLKRVTLIIEKSIVIKVFYPIFPPNKHIIEVKEWLKKN